MSQPVIKSFSVTVKRFSVNSARFFVPIGIFEGTSSNAAIEVAYAQHKSSDPIKSRYAAVEVKEVSQ